MGGLQNIGYFVIFLGVLVTVHELGHFLVAKWANVKVLKFSIGFGPRIFGFRRGETEYQVAWVPLGGYVRMAGELPGDDVAPEDLKRSFTQAPWWKRALIVLAGPAFNLLFPIIVYFFVSLGDHQSTAPFVGAVEADLPAAKAGILPGDTVTSIDGKPIREFGEIREVLDGVFDREVPITVRREGREVALRITPLKQVETSPVDRVQRGLLGISAVARPTIVGVPAGGAAQAAGLRTFDRVLTVNGELVRDELQLTRALAKLAGPLELVVVRSELNEVVGSGFVVPSLVTVKLDKQPGEGFAALGAESGDLYVWTVFADSPAEQAGLKRGDRLLSANGAQLASWLSMELQLRALREEVEDLKARAEAGEKPPPLRTFAMRWRSGAEEKSADIELVKTEEVDALRNKLDHLELGVRPRLAFQPQFGEEVLAAGPESPKVTIHLGPVDAARVALHQVPAAVVAIAGVFVKMAQRKISLDAMGGPIMLFQVAAKSAEAGREVFLKNMAIVSVNLGLVNLLPIPILDGFALLAALWEGVRRRPIPLRAREIANIVGLVMLGGLVVLVFWNDLSRFKDDIASLFVR